jgi:hypothetical protein
LDQGGRDDFKGHDIQYYLDMYNEVRAKTISELKREMMHGLLKSKKKIWLVQSILLVSCYGTSIQSFRANLVSKEANKTRVKLKLDGKIKN